MGRRCRHVWIVLTFLAGAHAASAHELQLVPVQDLEPKSEIVLISDSEVQGLITVFDWDGEKLEGRDLTPGSVLESADLIIRRVEPDYMILGVVMNTDGTGDEVIPPGTNSLATARFRCPSPDEDVPVDLIFRDGKYGTDALGPLLDNMLTVGGLTISREEGLILTGGSVSCQQIELGGKLRIKDAVQDPDTSCAPVDILLDSNAYIDGFTLSVIHDPDAIRLDAITLEGTITESLNPAFVESNVYPEGGTLRVLMNPTQEDSIPPGFGQSIARYVYCCKGELLPGSPDVETELRFVDGVLGDPPVENLLYLGGQERRPTDLISGTFTCRSGGIRPQEFHCGAELDPLTGDLLPVVGHPGETVTVSYYYRSLPKEEPGDTGSDRIQALSMAICFNPRYVHCLEDTFSLDGTITEAVGAEFIQHHCENDDQDGDPGELVVGILIDALPPFDGQTLPPTRDLLKVASIDFAITPDAPCDQCNEIEFCAAADGRGDVWIRNLITVNYQSRKPDFFNCNICVEARPVFLRGDCNFSGATTRHGLTISDPAAVVSFLFYRDSSRFYPPCLDSCDANDDGLVDLADAVFVLRFLFLNGEPPPPPGPDTPGPDPTPDRLDCQAGSDCP